jgi:hypothetical protein
VNCHFRRFLLVMWVAALAAITRPLIAQQAPPSPQPAQPVSSGTAAGYTSNQGTKGVIEFSYSADQVTVTTQTLADGTKITHKHLVKVYHDSEGRWRHESFGPGVESVGPNDLPQSVYIFDPVARVTYNLNPRDQTAQRTEIPRRAPQPPPQTTSKSAHLTPAHPVLPPPVREDLGTQVIEGLEARGERVTRTIPAGADGNDQPMQVTSESWTSAKPRLLLLRITNDPRRGETVMRLTNLVLEEPPEQLFQVPPDYTVEELQPVARPESPSE